MSGNRCSCRLLCVTAGAVAMAVAHSAPAWAIPADTYAATANKETEHDTKTVRYEVQRGDTLIAILGAHGLSSRTVAGWVAAIQRERKRLILRPRHILTLEFESSGRLESLQYDIDEETRLTVERIGSRVRARIDPVPVVETIVGAQGIIERNFHRAALRAGVPDRIISRMADILGWEFDFRRVHRGDRFRVVYERRVSTEGRVLTPGKVLAAEIRSRRKLFQAFYYDDGIEGVYLDAKGRVLSGGFLRYPVEFTRISSLFSHRRLHPILKKSRPHLGVDFVAPVGTPVRAVGDGVVKWAGWKGSFGRHVELRHTEGLVTTYSHLRRVAAGLRRGQAVRRGQVIGSVGRSGLATGAHLHFALFRNEQYVDPLNARVPLRHTVKNLERFEITRAELLAHLANVPRPATGVPVEPVMLSALPAPRRLGLVTITR